MKGKCVCGHRHENLTSHNKVLFELRAKWVCHWNGLPLSDLMQMFCVMSKLKLADGLTN